MFGMRGFSGLQGIVNGAEKWLTLHQHSDIAECLGGLKARLRGFRVLRVCGFGF